MDLISLVLNFLFTYIVAYLPIAALLLILVWYGNLLSEKSRHISLKRAIFTEAKMNIEIARSILDFVKEQNMGDPYVTPIPRFFTSAFEQLKNSGDLDYLARKEREELLAVYSAIERIDDASDRQEELVVGAAAGSPLAPDLRSNNLVFIQDAVANVVLPRLEHFSTFARR